VVDTIIVIIVSTVFGAWIYRQGKSIGSRKGFGVGLRRGRRR
jgi:hypothetical protein